MANSTMLDKRTLGESNLKLTALGLGCWQFSKGKGIAGRFWPTLSQQDINEIIVQTWQGGINWFDTAEFYGMGQSEMALSQALHEAGIQPGQVNIATKWWPFPRRASSIRETIGDRLRYLDGYPIDLYQVHQPYSLSGIDAQMHAMASLVHEGKIRYVGVSNYSAKQLRTAYHALQKEGVPLVSNQVKYSLLDRRIEHNGVLDTARELGIGIIAYSPLEQGLLTGKFHHDATLGQSLTGARRYQGKFKASGLQKTLPLIQELETIAANYGVSATQVALNWLVNFHGTMVFAIPGASKIAQAKENIKALTFTLETEELARLDAVSLHAMK